jgi:fission process protein 1
MSSADSSGGESKAEVDIFRETWVRYLGYANEVGESFGPLYPRFVRPSYGIAFAYVGADAVHKTIKAKTTGESMNSVVRTGVDVLLWQTLASVLIPGKIINLITAGAVKAFQSDAKFMKSLPSSVRTWSPTMIGLATIPFIIHPIDSAVDALFDNTLRKWWTKDEPVFTSGSK